jgi:hypothetical protein
MPKPFTSIKVKKCCICGAVGPAEDFREQCRTPVNYHPGDAPICETCAADYRKAGKRLVCPTCERKNY